MKYISIVVLLSVFVSVSAISQIAANASEEANPSYQYVRDNSPKAQLWRQIVAAKRANNVQLHKTLVEQYKTEFLQTASPSAVNPAGASKLPSQNGSSSGLSPDWGFDDVMVHEGPIGTPLLGTNDRTIQVETDTLGNLYAGVMDQGRDTIFVYKSTDLGMSWSQLNYVYWPGMSREWQSFDFFVADTANGMFKIGMVACATIATNYDGSVWWISMNDDGSDFTAVQIQTRPAGGGFINPTIVSDAYDWSPSISYWYVAYQSVDSVTGVGNAAIAALTDDWGDTWDLDSARTSFDDYDLDIDYNFGADTIHVLLTNNILPPNSNLRLRSTSLNDFATSSSWSQANVASTGDPEYLGCVAANRQTNEMVVTYTIEQSANENIFYSYNPTGETGISNWMTGNVLSAKANDESRARIDCQEDQGAYRVSYVSSGSVDTVIYTSTVSLPSTFSQHQVVNEDKSASTSTTPDVVGFHNAAFYSGGVIFAGGGPTNAYFDGSNLLVGIEDEEFQIPKTFSLSQNFPNPFNPNTQIEFTIPSPEKVTINLFDILGRKVATLVDDDYTAGTFKVTLDGSKLSSGNYFYQMTAGDFRATKKMLLLK